MLEINLDILKSFHILVKHLNFSKAAEELGYTQQALSYQIAQLEEKLSCRLFERLSQGLRLTEQGKLLLRELPALFQTLESTYAHLSQYTQAGACNKLSFYFSNGWDCDYLTAGFIGALIADFPGIEIESHWVLQENLKSKLLDDKEGVGFGYLDLEDQLIQTQELFSVPAVLAGRMSDVNQGEEPPFIAYQQEQTYPFSKILKDLKYDYTLDHILEPRLKSTQLIADSIAVYRQFGIAGQGAILTHFAAIQDAVLNQELEILATYPEIQCKGYLTWHSERTHQVSGSRLASTFQKFVSPYYTN